MIKVCEFCKKEYEPKYKCREKVQRYCSTICRSRAQYLSPDWVGKRFGSLVVIGLVENKNNKRYWNCQCDCGNTRIVMSSNLSNKKTTSNKCKKCKTEDMKNKKTLPNNEGERNSLISRYKASAKLRGLEFSLPLEDFVYLVKRECFYCGGLPANGNKYIFNGIDRVDNTKGYILDNVVTCCEQCNRMKMAYTKENFLNHITKIYNHQNQILK